MSVRVSLSVLSIASVIMPSVVSVAQGQNACLSCHDLQASGNGWFESPDPGLCGNFCTYPRKECVKTCLNTAPPASELGFAGALTPGVLTSQRGGKLLVEGILPGSPAEEVSILPGDEIATVNGKNPGTTCALMGWSAGGNARVALLVLRRGGIEREVTVPLVRFSDLTSNLWRSLHGLESDTEQRSQWDEMANGYSLGLRWSDRENVLQITAVLRGGAAESSGLLPGDEIVAIDSRSVRDHTAREMLRSGDRRFEVNLAVRGRGLGSPRNVWLRSGTLWEAIRNASYSGQILSASTL